MSDQNSTDARHERRRHLLAIAGTAPVTIAVVAIAVTASSGGHLRAVGTRTAGGVAATGYSGSIALAAAKKFLPASGRALFGSELGALRGDVEFTVWIDRRHRICELTENGRFGAATASVTITFYGFNQPAQIRVPLASQVVNLAGDNFSLS